MKLDIPKDAVEIVQKLEKAGFEAYIVGGAVHDLLMKRPLYDWDFATNATPQDLLKVFENVEAYYTNEFGTVGIPSEVEGERPYEITTFRTEHGYDDFRRPKKIKWGKNLEEDLKRRDFTINAMAIGKVKRQESKKDNKKIFTLSPSRSFTLTLIDPYKGQDDLKNKLIRAVGNPNDRFKEDALRMMRAVRIAAELNFKIEEKTREAIKKNAKLIHKIAVERVREELFKLLASSHSYEGIVQMREVGLIKELLPELNAAFGVEQKSPGRHHIHDVGTHSLLSLKNCKSEDAVVKLATLMHDLGKTNTRKVLDTQVVTFYNHEVVSARIAKKFAKKYRLSKKDADKLWRLVRFHQFTVDERQTDAAIRRFIKRTGKELVPDMLDLRVADRLGGGARETSWRLEEFKKRLIEVQKQPFTVHDLKISGTDVMKELNLKPSPKVGEILEKLYKEVVDKKIPNEKKALLNRLKNLK